MMKDKLSPKFKMQYIQKVNDAIFNEYSSYQNVEAYISNWQEWNEPYNNFEPGYFNFEILRKGENGPIDLIKTLNKVDDELLMKMAIDLGIETPTFLPSVPIFRNILKDEYKTASQMFEEAFKSVEQRPDEAVRLANSALESIIKKILGEDAYKGSDTLGNLTKKIINKYKLEKDIDIPGNTKPISTGLLNVCKGIESIRSEHTTAHGKNENDIVISDPVIAYFIINATTTIGMFLNSLSELNDKPVEYDGLPF